MTAPSPTDRATPGGTRVENGHATLVTISTDTDISFWEISVKPIGIDGGDMVDTTTMHNTNVRTHAPSALYDVTDLTGSAAYDPVVLDQILAQINVPATITITHPNGDQWAFFGCLRIFEPDENTEGEMPTASFTISATNTDPSSGAEEIPNYVTAAGTD